MGVVKAGHRRDLGHVARQEDLIRVVEFIEPHDLFMHHDAIGPQVLDMPRPGDARQERTVRHRRENLTILDGKDIRRRGFGHIAQGISDQRIVEPLAARLGQHPRVIWVKARGLGIDHRVLQHRAPEPRPGQRRRRIGRGHGDLFKTDGKTGLAVLLGHDGRIPALNRPIHRPDIDRRIRGIGLEALLDDLHHLFGRDVRRDHQRLGRGIDPRAVLIEIGRQPIGQPRAVKHVTAEPHAMIGSLHDGDVALVPSAVEIGADILASRHVPSRSRRKAYAAGFMRSSLSGLLLPKVCRYQAAGLPSPGNRLRRAAIRPPGGPGKARPRCHRDR